MSALEFAIYPLGVAGTPQGLTTGPPDDYRKIRAALRDLGDVPARVYLVDMEPGGEEAVLRLAERYRSEGILDHVVVGCMRDAYDRDRWTELVRAVVARHGDTMQSLQVTNEPNLSFMDGSKPYVYDALVDGVRAASSEARRRGMRLDVGFGSVPQSDVAVPTFWRQLRVTAGGRLEDEVDFVGHNFYVDVFEPAVEPREVADRVRQILRDLRRCDIPAAGLPATLPIRVTENGWPTGTNPFTGEIRTEARQAEVLETVIRAVHADAAAMNITQYSLFGLRDADSGEPGLFHQFGIARHDYTPKPAFAIVRGLIRELSRPR